ncbi:MULTISPECIES: ImpA family type VI secretion system protein [Sphingomonas]|uniref:type VI secretion system protein TssA n=1 Tax=Sphingomonas TaxID=13687 RepID=UPI0012EEA1E5|nr:MULTISPECIES: type VI secretion system ImpA family N-terminal domain-containing protein [Sphingomonas]MBA2920553.1 type VI secretion system ImpA family N-terminal domain-containing protein [Sphingomonas sp. CGMCC 1.13658]
MIDEETRQAILAPIDDSVGIDGREDEGDAGELLRDIRSQRKALIRQEQAAAMGESPADEGLDWDGLSTQAQDYLSRFGKDLEPMAALLEAQVRIDGPLGLAEAMTLLADLVEAFWDRGLYPAEDEDGVETRFQPLSGVSGGSSDRDGALIQPVRRMELGRAGGESLRYLDKVKADMLMASAQIGSPDQKAAKTDEADAAYRMLEALARRISRADLEGTAQALGEAEASWRRAIGFISEQTKPRFPAASKLSDELQAIREWLGSLIAKSPEAAGGRDSANESAATAEAGESPALDGQADSAAMLSGRIGRREDALRAVSMAADYFVTHEPLSPIGQTLREVDRRARMSLHDYLAELIPDESARDDFYWRSGIRPPSQQAYGDTSYGEESE